MQIHAKNISQIIAASSKNATREIGKNYRHGAEGFRTLHPCQYWLALRLLPRLSGCVELLLVLHRPTFVGVRLPAGLARGSEDVSTRRVAVYRDPETVDSS